MSDAQKLTVALEQAGATRDKVIEIIDDYGDPIGWGDAELVDIVGEVWDSDINGGDTPDSWIINGICDAFDIAEVTE